MGKLEQEVRIQTRNSKIQKAILATVAVAGFLAVAAVAPNVIQILGQLPGTKKGKWLRKTVDNSRYRLVALGLLARDQRGYLQLTSKGEMALRHMEIQSYQIKKPRRWDKKWRIIIFDIKEQKHSLRDKIRNTLVCIGFKRLQHSVWVYPYDCEDLIALLKVDFKIGKEVLYLIVDKIENDIFLKKAFGLKLSKEEEVRNKKSGQ